jgi:hypothetical protein
MWGRGDKLSPFRVTAVMLGDEPVGDIALAEADVMLQPTAVSATAVFFWTVEAEAVFGWSDETVTATFGWE